jgi:hypothetical protein
MVVVGAMVIVYLVIRLVLKVIQCRVPFGFMESILLARHPDLLAQSSATVTPVQSKRGVDGANLAA